MPSNLWQQPISGPRYERVTSWKTNQECLPLDGDVWRNFRETDFGIKRAAWCSGSCCYCVLSLNLVRQGEWRLTYWLNAHPGRKGTAVAWDTHLIQLQCEESRSRNHQGATNRAHSKYFQRCVLLFMYDFSKPFTISQSPYIRINFTLWRLLIATCNMFLRVLFVFISKSKSESQEKELLYLIITHTAYNK